MASPCWGGSGSRNEMPKTRGERDDGVGGEEDSPQKIDASVEIDVASETCQRYQWRRPEGKREEANARRRMPGDERQRATARGQTLEGKCQRATARGQTPESKG